MDLASLATSYLRAAGYEVSRKERDLLIGTKSSLAQATESILVWVPVIEHGNPWTVSREGPYLNRFETAAQAYPSAQKFMLVPTLQGMSSEFRQGSKRWHNVNIRVPIHFFDTPFRVDEFPDAASSAVGELRRKGKAALERRIAQPYAEIRTDQTGPDLIETVFATLRSPDESSCHVQLVVGPAGIGKTFFFEALFYRLYSAFLEDKKREATAPRPLPLTPEYLDQSDAPTIKALVRAFLNTDFARSIDMGVFEWMMTNGFGIWMLDGLDEIIDRDTEFFNYLLELLTRPEVSPPKIVICVRDSLLATNDDLANFCEAYWANIDVYQLQRWNASAKRQFAARAVPSHSESFVQFIESHPAIRELSSTPYYCQLMAEQYVLGPIKEYYSETSLLRDAVSHIIKREYDKGLLDRHLVPESEITEFLEAIAAEDLEGGFQGVSAESLRDWAQIVLPRDLSSDQFDRFIVQMSQLPVFTRGLTAGNVRFAQELIEQFLLGQYLAGLFEVNRDSFMTKLSTRLIAAEWITLKALAEHVKDKGQGPILFSLAHGASNDTALRNVVQLAALARSSPNALKDWALEHRNLSGVVFEDLDLGNTSFRGSNLTDAEFHACNLRSANFEDAIIKNTSFDLPDTDSLRGAKFGSLTRFYSLQTEHRRLITEHRDAGKWIEARTGSPSEIREPCGPALQMRHLFGKFVHPDGTARRATLDRRGVLGGKVHHDPDATLEAAIKYGFLREEERFRDRVQRADGERYSEMIEFVKGLHLSAGLRDAVSELCQVPDCPHVPGATD